MTTLVRYARWSVIAAVVLASMSVGVGPAAAQGEKEKGDFEDTIHVLQRKPILEKNRVELTPRFGTSINDSIHRSFKLGTNINYHVSERVYVGGLFEWYDFGSALGGPTSTFEKSYDQTSTTADAPVLNWYGGAEAGFKPIYGKFALFNLAILYYELGATLGVGYANAESITLPNASGTFGATGSVNMRLFLNDWMAFDFELRDILFPATVATGGGNQTNTIGNIATFSGGISLYLPTSSQKTDEESN